ncbi:MAG: AraC family transcriptional regulator [Rhizobiales bacterium]|nr:AraC family transcriptional regulator [Hyphomicrobiales bacterium]
MDESDSVIHDRPMISCNVLRCILDETNISDIKLDRLLATEDLSIADVYEFNGKLKLNSYLRLLDGLVTTMGDPLFGLKISKQMKPSLAGATGYIFLCSPTLEEGLIKFTKHIGSIQEVTSIKLETTESGLNFIYSIDDDSIYPRRQDVSFSIGYFYQMINLYLGDNFRPKEVHFEFESLQQISFYENFFNCDVFFDQFENFIAIDRKDLMRSNKKFDKDLIPILENYLRSETQYEIRPGSFTEYVSKIIQSTLTNGVVTLASVSIRIGITEAKVRQKLKSEGCSFKKLLLDQKIGLAKRLLIDTDNSILEIANRCGYSETASFSRAFSSLTTYTPRDYRKIILL